VMMPAGIKDCSRCTRPHDKQFVDQRIPILQS
jgi:hypothetical protein